MWILEFVYRFVGAFVLRNVTTNVIMSVRPPVRIEQLACHWKDFYEILYLIIFRKSVGKFQVSLKSYKNDS